MIWLVVMEMCLYNKQWVAWNKKKALWVKFVQKFRDEHEAVLILNLIWMCFQSSGDSGENKKNMQASTATKREANVTSSS